MQRVACARAFAVSPEILLADEPTSELDEGNREHVMDQLRIEAARGAIVVVATHDPAVVDASDRRLVLDEGRLVPAEGSRVRERTVAGVLLRAVRAHLLPSLATLLLAFVVSAGAVAVVGASRVGQTPGAVAAMLALYGAVALAEQSARTVVDRSHDVALARLRGLTGGRLVLFAAGPLLALSLVGSRARLRDRHLARRDGSPRLGGRSTTAWGPARWSSRSPSWWGPGSPS